MRKTRVNEGEGKQCVTVAGDTAQDPVVSLLTATLSLVHRAQATTGDSGKLGFTIQ